MLCVKCMHVWVCSGWMGGGGCDPPHLNSWVPRMRVKVASLCNIPCTLARREGLVDSPSCGNASICITAEQKKKEVRQKEMTGAQVRRRQVHEEEGS